MLEMRKLPEGGQGGKWLIWSVICLLVLKAVQHDSTHSPFVWPRKELDEHLARSKIEIMQALDQLYSLTIDFKN